MRICIYCEALVPPTTGTPMRIMVSCLIQLRPNDHFILVVRKGSLKDNVLNQFFKEIGHLNNWEIWEEGISRRLSNILGLLRYPHYCSVTAKSDVYISPDTNSLGKYSHPLIVAITDLSSFNSLSYTSYKWRWQLWLRRFMIRNGVEKSDIVVSISENTKRDIVKKLRVTKPKSVVIYNGIRQEWLELSVKLNTEVALPYWIWWGMISGRKNLENLFRAYGIVKRRLLALPGLVIIYGNKVLPPGLLEVMREENLVDDIRFEKKKPLDELITMVSLSRGLVFPSFVEGFGMPVIEAFARGIPVLTSNSSSLTEVSGGLSILVNPEEVGDIARGLEELLEADFAGEAINARQRWAAQFSSSRAAEGYSALIDEL